MFIENCKMHNNNDCSTVLRLYPENVNSRSSNPGSELRLSKYIIYLNKYLDNKWWFNISEKRIKVRLGVVDIIFRIKHLVKSLLILYYINNNDRAPTARSWF